MKAKEVHKYSEEEIQIEVKRLRRKIFDIRMQAVTEKIQDTSQMKKLRQDVARLLGERNQRRVKAASAAAASSA